MRLTEFRYSNSLKSTLQWLSRTDRMSGLKASSQGLAGRSLDQKAP